MTCLKSDPPLFEPSSIDGVGVGAVFVFGSSEPISESNSNSLKTLSSVGGLSTVGIEYSASSSYE